LVLCSEICTTSILLQPQCEYKQSPKDHRGDVHTIFNIQFSKLESLLFLSKHTTIPIDNPSELTKMLTKPNLLFTVTLFALLFAKTSRAVCPGYNFGFLNNNGLYNIITDDCIPVYVCNQDGNTPNPCSCPSLGCSAAPVHVNSVKWDGHWYYCRGDPNSGGCDWNNGGALKPVESCVRTPL